MDGQSVQVEGLKGWHDLFFVLLVIFALMDLSTREEIGLLFALHHPSSSTIIIWLLERKHPLGVLR